MTQPSERERKGVWPGGYTANLVFGPLICGEPLRLLEAAVGLARFLDFFSGLYQATFVG